MEITKEHIRDLFTTMHLSKVTIGQELRKSERLAAKAASKAAAVAGPSIPTIKDEFHIEEKIYKEEQKPYTPPITSTSDLDLLKTPARSSTKETYPFTTLSRELYNAISPDNQDHFLEVLRQDDIIIRSKFNIEDKPFNEIDGSEMGVYIESWLCANLFCPGCGDKTLYKYSHPNMPVIDVACVNKAHVLEHGPRYYQIKATQNIGDYKYFTRQPIPLSPTGYIKVGSKRYGKFSHQALVTNDDDKDLVIGYICIIFKQEGNMKITINPDESFILIPDLTLSTKVDESGAYYKYLYTNKSVVVCYNPNYVNLYPLNICLKKSELKNIEINYLFQYSDDTTIHDVLHPKKTPVEDEAPSPPVPPTPLGKRLANGPVNGPAKKPANGPANRPDNTFYKKYLMYKTKYINLKLSNLKID